MDLTEANAERPCPRCGEPNPQNFDTCWKCSGELAGGELMSAATRRDDVKESARAVVDSLPASANRGMLLEVAAIVLVSCVYPFSWKLFAEEALSQPSVGLILTSIPSRLGLGLLAWELARRSQAVASTTSVSMRRWFTQIPRALLLCAAAWIVQYNAGIVASMFGLPYWRSDWIPQEVHRNFAIAFSIHTLFSAFFEEAVFRVYLPARIQAITGSGPLLAIVMSSILFALSHGYSPHDSLTTFAFGILFGVVYQWTRQLPCLVMAHWWYDIILMLRNVR